MARADEAGPAAVTGAERGGRRGGVELVEPDLSARAAALDDVEVAVVVEVEHRAVPGALQFAHRHPHRALPAARARLLGFEAQLDVRADRATRIVHDFQHAIATGEIDVDVRLDHVGLNHLTWIRHVGVDGVDRLPELLAAHGAQLAERLELPQLLIERLGVVPSYYLRYYYASKLGRGVDDLDLNLEDFVQKVNSDLVGKVVNIASRCAGFIHKGNAGVMVEGNAAPELTEAFLAAAESAGRVGVHVECAPGRPFPYLPLENLDALHKVVHGALFLGPGYAHKRAFYKRPRHCNCPKPALGLQQQLAAS